MATLTAPTRRTKAPYRTTRGRGFRSMSDDIDIAIAERLAGLSVPDRIRLALKILEPAAEEPDDGGEDLATYRWTDLRVALGYNVRRLRREQGIAQREIAKQLSIPQPRISELERGRVWPRPELLLLLCEILQCRPPDLLAG